MTEGPCPVDPHLIRADITEGREGIPMRLQGQVFTAERQPVMGARVNIWQCDARGIYLGAWNMGDAEDTSGQTLLSGTQTTDARGVTIYPGWYRGRITHILCIVFLDDTTVLTSQMFFPDALSQYLFRNVARCGTQ